MLKLITKYGLAAHLAFLAVAPLFLSPVPVLWLSALATVWLLMEPSRVGDEMLHGARERVAFAVIRDPLFWVLLVLVLWSGLRALNDGVDMVYQAEVVLWVLTEPKWPILPGCVGDGAGFEQFSMVIALVVVVIGCRHAMGRAARYAFALVASSLAGLILVAEHLFFRAPTEQLVRAATCSYENPVFIGVAYGLLLLLALCALTAAFERRWWAVLPLVFIALIGSSLGLFLYAPAYLSVLFAGGALVIILYGFLYLRLMVERLSDFKSLVVIGLSLAVAVVLTLSMLPEATLNEKLAPFMTGHFLSDEFLAARDALSRLSLDIWKSHPWLGTGLGSYALDLNYFAVEADWKIISPLQTAPLNGYWLLLVERGVVGAFILSVPLVLLLIGYIRGLILGGLSLPHPLALLAPVVFIVFAVATLVDCSVLTPGVLLLSLAIIALSGNAFAKKEGWHG